MRWLFFIPLFLLSACLFRPSEPLWETPPTVDQLLSQIALARGQYLSLDGAASVSLSVDDKFLSSQQYLLLQKPNRLRADVLTGFGQLILQMTSDGEILSVLLNTTVPGRYLCGPASYENIVRFTRVPLKAEDFLTLLLYDPPIAAYLDSHIEMSAGGVMLVLSGQGSRQELLFDRKLKLVGCRYFDNKEMFLSVDYQKFSKENNFPRMIAIEIPKEQTRVKVKFSELKVNGVIDVTRFQLQKPNNIPLEPLP